MNARIRNVVVTGAGRNIGRAIALELAAVGMGVALVDLDPGALERVRADIAEVAPQVPVAVCPCDVTVAGSVRAMVEQALAELGDLYALVNCVAVTDRGATILDLADDEWHRVMDACLTSTFYCSREVARQLVAQRAGGAIIHIGSTSGHLGRSNATAYPTAKSALIGLTRSMARQLGPHGIRVNLVAPNKAGSPVGQKERKPDRNIRNLVGRAGEPEDVARAVRYLVSDDAGFITGVDLFVDGGAVLLSGTD